MSSPELEANPAAFVAPPETQTPTRATTEQRRDTKI
jgi:hypothetical protein